MKSEKQKINSRGFTVLESIVAIMVLSLSIAGAFTAIQHSLSQAIIAKDEVRAFYLAQEAVEVIRNKRDQNQLKYINLGSDSWLDGIVGAGNCPFDEVCSVDAKADDPFTYCGDDLDDCPNLKQDASTYLYGYTGNDTNINRSVMIEQVGANEISITVQVKWTKGITTYSFKAKTHLFDWI